MSSTRYLALWFAAALFAPAYAQDDAPSDEVDTADAVVELSEEERAAAEAAAEQAAAEAEAEAEAAKLRAIEREWYRTVRDRFAERMKEITQDTRDYVKVREAEEREQLVSGYDNLLGSLEELGIAQRDLALERFESFLDRYPDAEYSSHIRFRLADLYFEVASEEFLAASDAYYDALGSDDLAVLDALGEEPQLDLALPVKLYQRIIDDNVGLAPDQRYERLDGVYLMLGFCYSDETSAQRDERLARAVFRDLIREVPESELADRSHLFLGNYAFAEGDYTDAMAEYEQVISKGDDSPYYNEAVYQLAWSRYKLSEYGEALRLFVDLLDRSLEYERGTGRELPYAPDAVRFMAFSFADSATELGQDALMVAERFFRETLERPYERDVYKELADILLRYTRPEEAIAVYRKLQDDPRWKNEPDNPEHLMAIVRLYSTNFIVRDLEKSGAERLKLTERYSEGGTWWEANRNNPDALATATGFMESSLLGVAQEYFVRAQESGDQGDYSLAAAKYKEYLDKFPISDDYFEQQWYLATALRMAGRWDEAADEYAALVRDGRFHPFLDGAMYSRMDTRLQAMPQTSGAPDQPPSPATVESVEELADGSSLEIYALSDDRLAFIEAVDALAAHTFSDNPPADLPDYAAAYKDNAAALAYLPAQIYYYHNHYEEARRRFFEVVDRYPRTDEASFSAGLILDSFIAENDLEEVRRWSKAFATRVLGKAEIPDQYFADQLEGSTFKLAMGLAETGELEEAAEAFLSFRREFPSSKLAPDALHNAAIYLQSVGRVDQANRLYEEFVSLYPNNEKSSILYFKIAANYEATFDLERAVRYYQQLVRFFPADVNTPDATYNSAYLQLGLKRYQAAANGFEQYAMQYPDRGDSEAVFYSAGDAWERVGESQALQFYQRYLDRYGNTDPNHALEAEARMANILRSRGDERGYQRGLDGITRRFNAIVATGETVGARGQAAAAEAGFREIDAAFLDLTDEVLTRDEERDATLLQDLKPVEVREFGALVDRFVRTYGDFEYLAKAQFLKAKSLLYLADLGLGLEPPDGFTEDQQWAYLDVLEEQVFPTYYAYEDQGVERLVEVLDFAKRNRRYGPTIDQTQVELNRRRPEEYPALKRELIARPSTTDLVLPEPIEQLETETEAAPDASDTGSLGGTI